MNQPIACETNKDTFTEHRISTEFDTYCNICYAALKFTVHSSNCISHIQLSHIHFQCAIDFQISSSFVFVKFDSNCLTTCLATFESKNIANKKKQTNNLIN